MIVTSMKLTVCLVFLFLLASFLRLYQIDALTEFLGDQGRTGIEIYTLWEKKELPLVGPQVLSGQHLGPFFYYLVAPSFILFNFNPLDPAIFIALLGIASVFLFFHLSQKFFGKWTSFFITSLFAVSPYIVTQSRILWEPNVIPFFLLLLLLSWYQIYEKKKFSYFLLTGFSLSALVQLHYPNLFFIVLTGLLILVMILQKKIVLKNKNHVLWIASSAFVFLLVLSPFLLYEFKNQFTDVKSIMKNFLFSKTSYVTYGLIDALKDQSSRLFKNIIPGEQSILFTIIQIVILFFPLFYIKTFWYRFFLVWFICGLLIISHHSEVIVDHYLTFLLPVPFFIFGFFIESIKKYIPRSILYYVLSFLVLMNLAKTDIVMSKNNDIERTKILTTEMKKQAKNKPFSFTLISSRSFSDLHYRYFMKLEDVKPTEITSKKYSTLFLVCDGINNCPKLDELIYKQKIQVMCYEYNCRWDYPIISLEDYTHVLSREFSGGRLYTFQRK